MVQSPDIERQLRTWKLSTLDWDPCNQRPCIDVQNMAPCRQPSFWTNKWHFRTRHAFSNREVWIISKTAGTNFLHSFRCAFDLATFTEPCTWVRKPHCNEVQRLSWHSFIGEFHSSNVSSRINSFSNAGSNWPLQYTQMQHRYLETLHIVSIKGEDLDLFNSIRSVSVSQSQGSMRPENRD